MAIVQTDKAVVSIRGRCGGVYFKKDKLQHVQAMPRHVKHAHSAFMKAGVDAYSGAAVFWLLALIAGYALLWAGFAVIWLFTDEEGRKKRITGYNWYIHYALTFPERDEFHPFWKPPHSPYDLPDYVVTYQGKQTYYHDVSSRPPESPTGYYWDTQIPWNGKPWFITDNKEWSLWWKGPTWVISPGPGLEPPATTSYSPGGDIIGWYHNPVTSKYTHVYNGKRQIRGS